MESITLKHKIILGTLAFLVVIIPVISFIVSYRFRAQVNTRANTNPNVSTLEDLSIRPIVDNPTPQKTLLEQLKEDLEKESSAEAEIIETGLGNTLILGPTLTFRIQIDSRPKNNNADPKLFVGLAAGQETTNPQYLLSFTVEATTSGEPREPLSLSGLTTNDTYTAYLKGQNTLTAASTFTVKPTTANIGTVNLTVGDLNDDNVIDSLDKDILMKAFGAREGSEKWNPLADFNIDGVINTADLAYINKNLNKNGDSGPWGSKLPPSATVSGSLRTESNLGGPDSSTPSASPQGGPRDIPSGQSGYWMWVPSGI